VNRVQVKSIQDIVDNRDATYLLIYHDESTENIEIDTEYYADIEMHVSDGELYRVIPDEPVLEVGCVSFRNEYGQVKTFVKGSSGHKDYLNKSEYWTQCNPVIKEVGE
jgi:hypothetical protein